MRGGVCGGEVIDHTSDPFLAVVLEGAGVGVGLQELVASPGDLRQAAFLGGGLSCGAAFLLTARSDLPGNEQCSGPSDAGTQGHVSGLPCVGGMGDVESCDR
ncbi:hypothetical protein GCM10007147_23060 [Nocardiopsis kunsanensis]|uniref:Uncharacterized protein n=1 Tax=Nocardiopsis kunsanensis TaxID=141693 RepID=A0A918XCQ4_9ACTN|nr:hypothetical protein GCM10007147_23060 [Nocardiopsis kunsanensis]